MRVRPLPRLLVLLFLLLCAAPLLRAQGGAGGRVLLVLPFDNRTGQANLDWIGESFAETLDARLSSAGYLTISRADRDYALDHLGLPVGFRPSRATTIRIAQTLDAEYVVVGHFTQAGDRIAAEAEVLQVNRLHMGAPVADSSDLRHLLDLENTIAWKCARQIDPAFPVALGTFLAASNALKLDSYENYIRGITAQNNDERIKRLKAAVSSDPKYVAAILALGKAQFAARDYDAAASTFAAIPNTSPAALEANFYRGLARFNYAKYSEAEGAFAFVASKLPLPEVVNDEGVAQARQKKDGSILLQRASAEDPQDGDYRYNVAVALRRKGNLPGAKAEAEQAVKLRPSDGDAKQLLAVLNGAAAQPSFDPTERIRRTYSEAGVRQAAFQVDQMRLAKIAALPPTERAAALAQSGRDYLAAGLVLEAEREFLQAIAADPNCGPAHLGIAQVRDRAGDIPGALTEADAAIRLTPTAQAYVLRGRLLLQSGKLADSAASVGAALKLEPRNAAAADLRTALTSRGQAIP